MRHQLLRYHKEDGIDQCRIERIQKELCNTLAQILSQTTRHSQAIQEVVSVPQEQYRHLSRDRDKGI